MAENELLAAALKYAARGWAVLPLVPGHKEPLIPKKKGGHGVHDATTDAEIIRGWWAKCPTANIGIATAEVSGGLLVIDLDNKKGSNAPEDLKKWEAINGPLPDTLTVKTPSGQGRHLYYHADVVLSSDAGVRPGVDIRSNNSYAVAPPSVFNGRHYQWENPGADLAEINESGLKFIDFYGKTESEVKQKAAKQKDPTEKPGYIGAFCRAHDIPDTINVFLSEVYTPTENPDRYTYAAGSTTGGLVVYDDGKFAYSFHGTDPARNRLCNSFDLARIHLYGKLDEDIPDTTPAGERPSFKAMFKLAQDDPETRDEYNRLSGVPGGLIKKLQELNAAQNYDRSDKGAGRLFSDIFEDGSRYCPEWKSWAFYDGKRWKRDTGAVKARQSGKLLSDALMIYAPEAGLPEKEKGEFYKYCAGFGALPRRERMINDAESNKILSASELDSDPLLLNVNNGVLDFRSNAVNFREHSPGLLLGKIAPVNYDPEARCPVWIKFVDDIMMGNAEKIDYLQRWAGLCLTGIAREESMLILYGPTTRNGKSTFVETLKSMLGDYAVTIQPETIAQRKRNSSNASGDIARLAGARLVLAPEPPKGMLFDAAVLKAMTGRDTITARAMYEREVEFKPYYKIIMNTNYLPSINDDTLFTSGRIEVLTFDRHFDDVEQDKGLKDKLLEPSELSGVLNWMIEGLRMYLQGGLTPPASVRAAVEDYRSKNDRVGNFFADCLKESPEGVLAGTDVYNSYRGWCFRSGLTAEGKSSFFESLRRRGLLKASATINGEHKRNVVCGFLPGDDYV